MGSFDGAECCELVGLYLLSQLQHIDIDVGLYRDNGLAICSKTPNEVDDIKKEICHIFTVNGLNITIEVNKKVINFLDITMDLNTDTFKPYMKPNNSLLYVHKDSNHPPSVLKNIPESVNKRLSSISSNAEIFNSAIPPYQDALNKSGYSYQLNYKLSSPPTNIQQRRNRKRNITWYNPPYSDNVSTNVGKKFLCILDKCFPPGHELHKILNRHTVKVSYSCMPNMRQIISSHNKSVMNNTSSTPITSVLPAKNCNCRNKPACPLDGKCLTTGVIYQATITRQDTVKKKKHT
jgi:hypothetical protein